MSLVAAYPAPVDRGPIAAAFAELTPEQVRILVLSAARRGDLDELASSLGLPRAQVAVLRTGIRRTFGMTAFEELRAFVERTPQLAELLHVADARSMITRPGHVVPSGEQERRQQLVLRAGIEDVQALGHRLAGNVAAIRSFLEMAAPAQAEALEDEAESLCGLAEELLRVAERAVKAARRSS